MSSYLERKQKYSKYFSPSYRRTVVPENDYYESDLPIDTGRSLKKEELKKNFQYLNPIREYMIERKGVDYENKSADEVVEDFVDHMRYFNANVISTAGEVRFVTKANERQKAKADKAYRIYDQLGNVFVNDGAMGAVDGIRDYIYGAATDPTNALGLLTGGMGRAFAAGVSVTGKQTVRQIVRKAGMEAAQSGASKAEARRAGRKAGMEAARRAIAQGIDRKTAGGLYKDVSKRVNREGRAALARDAMKKKQSELFKMSDKYSLMATTAIDGSLALLQEVQAQQAYIEVGAQENYNKLMIGFSPLLGGVAGAAQLGFGKFRGASGLGEDLGDPLEKVANAVIEETAPVFKKEQVKDAGKMILKAVDTWNKKVERGQDVMTADLIHDIMLGPDKQGGLAKMYKDMGFKISREKHISDVMTNVMRFLPPEDITKINEQMVKHTGINLGDLTGSRTKLSDYVSKTINEAGKTLNVMSQVRQTLDAGIVAANNKLTATLDEVEAKDVLAKEMAKAKKSQKYKYGQSVWKRLLVSSPATTAVNVAGFSQFFLGQTLADLFNGTNYMILGAGHKALGNREAAAESFRRGRALGAIQAQKMRNLLDPYTTHDAYMRFLDGNQDVRKTLFETISGGIDATADRFNMDPNSKLFRATEAFANTASISTGVKIQDSFTKSQMFMTELDKYLRLEKKTTLKEAMLMDENIVDDIVLQGALDGTLKSVFAKDYTTESTPELLRTFAKVTETVSNTPVFGTIIPFGRFFNNVIATTYQWSPFAAPEIFFDFVKRTYKKEGTDFSEGEAFGRMMVGTTAILMAADFDKERREKGLSVYEMDVGGGTIIDAKNSFPFSSFLVAGRVWNMISNGETVPPELLQEVGTQVAVGQLARDAQFGNDINNMLDVLINSDGATRGMTVDGLNKVAGNFLAGFTRPVDFVNKAVGFAMGTDGAKDVRQASGMNVLTQTSTKYVDNLIEALGVKVDSITGEDLKMATREGEQYDANPLARIFGITVKRGKTATEKAYSVAEMFPWTANERTAVPAYDKAMNVLVAPVLEHKFRYLLNSPSFKSASLTGKRDMVKQVLSDTKRELREDMGTGWYGAENERLRLAAKASNMNKELRQEAKQIMRDNYGVTADIADMSYSELDMFFELMDYLSDIYEEAASI